MTIDDARPDDHAPPLDHPWYLDLRPDPARDARDTDALAALKALDAIGAIVIAVSADPPPSLADMVARRGYVGWTILVPGSVERRTIEDIAALAGAGYLAAIAPGHPLPSPMPRGIADQDVVALRAPSPATHVGATAWSLAGDA